MRLTHTHEINTRIDRSDELNDGLFIFCSQGKTVLEMVENTDNSNGAKTFVIYVYAQKKDVDLLLTELESFGTETKDIQDKYTVQERIVYTSAQEAHAHLMMLIAHHNHF